MGWLRIIAVSAGVMGVGLLGVLSYGATLPTVWTVEVSRTLPVPPAAVLPQLHSAPRLVAWFAPPEGGGTILFGPEQGPGGGWTWDTAETNGRFEITGADDRGVTYAMSMENDWSQASGEVRVAADGDGARVTWRDSGDIHMWPVGGLMARLMESMLSQHFESALARLERQVGG